MAGENFPQGDALAAFVCRLEELQASKDGITADMIEIRKEAKAAGFNIKVLNKVLARRRRVKAEVSEEDDLILLYEDAVERGLHELD